MLMSIDDDDVRGKREDRQAVSDMVLMMMMMMMEGDEVGSPNGGFWIDGQ